MQVMTIEREDAVEQLQYFAGYFKEFDEEVTKASLPRGYEAPVSRWLKDSVVREVVSNGKSRGVIVGAPVARDMPVADFTGNIKFVMHRGDMFIERIAFQDFECIKDEIARILDRYDNIFFELWEEKPLCRQFVEYFNLKWLCTKILQTDELVGVYGRCARNFSVGYDRCDLYSAKKLEITTLDVTSCVRSLDRVPGYINHYSTCNKENTWSAVSLRGYGGLAEFISKPSEMSDKWKSDNPEKLAWCVFDSPLRAKLPEFEPLIDALPGRKQRIRLMRLKPRGGEIYRHTDIQDQDAGIDEGKLIRVHIPIVTNESVKFECWDLRGASETKHMTAGEAWYMDVRKPHRVENYGKTDRIHLVIDVESNESLRRMISGQTSPQIVLSNDCCESLSAF